MKWMGERATWEGWKGREKVEREARRDFGVVGWGEVLMSSNERFSQINNGEEVNVYFLRDVNLSLCLKNPILISTIVQIQWWKDRSIFY